MARTFQNNRLFPGITGREDLMVAQRNALMKSVDLDINRSEIRAAYLEGGRWA